MRGEGNKIIEDLKKPAKPMTEQDMMDMALNFGPMAVGSISSKVIPRIRSGISDLAKKLSNEHGSYTGQRIIKAADLVPNLEQQYTPNALKNAFGGRYGDNATGVMVMNPKFFEEYAAPIGSHFGKFHPKTFNDWLGGSTQEHVDELANIARDSGFSEVPFLTLGKDLENNISVLGHEGRHRNRALTQLGDNSTLVQMIPSGQFREPFPRRSQEEYIEALKDYLGLDEHLITPESKSDIKVPLPEIFADGGSTTQTSPKQGGLSITEYPNPYGLRSFVNEDSSYGGQMMPKTSGWAGEIPAHEKGRTITEFSLGGSHPNEPFYPMVYKGITPDHIEIVRDYEAGLRDHDDPLVKEVKDAAAKTARELMQQGKSPFKDYN